MGKQGKLSVLFEAIFPTKRQVHNNLAIYNQVIYTK